MAYGDDTRRGFRSATTRLSSFAFAHPGSLLVLVAALPFLPGLYQFIHRGLVDVLFTGDGATLEIRTLHAVHGTQMTGAYSRFKWSHPGPAFFYLAAPFYQLSQRRGPALNLFAFMANAASAIGLAVAARRLRGYAWAFLVSTLLAVYECVAAEFQLSSEWNPIVPILPLGLLSLIGARLAVGTIKFLPLFAFLASAIVQTHVGFVPVVLLLAGLVAVFRAADWSVRRWRKVRAHDQNGAGCAPTGAGTADSPMAPPALPRTAWWLVATVGVMGLLWILPLIENATSPVGNLEQLYTFFTAPHVAEHDWPVVRETVARQLALTPLGLVRTFAAVAEPSPPVLIRLAFFQVMALTVMLADGVRRRDRVVAALAAVPLVEIAAAAFAVRAIRGEIQPYLVSWISVVGLMSICSLAAWFVPGRPGGRGWHRRITVGLGLAAVLVLCLCVRSEGQRVDVFRAPDPDAERLAREVHRYLRSPGLERPLVRIATGDAWPTAAAVVLYLYKHEVPIFVEEYWLFMMGAQFASRSDNHPLLFIGDRAFYDTARTRRDLRPIAVAGNSCAFMGEPRYLEKHRLTEPGRLLAAEGVRGDPLRAVDGVVPQEGTQWDSPLSTVLLSTASFIEVAVPRTKLNGIFLSVDGADTYGVQCVAADGGTRTIGSLTAGVAIGMGTGFLFDNQLESCHGIAVKPERGDGYYSVGEIGFLTE